MVAVESRVRRYGSVTLVEVVVENDGERPRRVRIESRLDGPVWPPRTRGRPEAEWDGETLSVRVDPDECRSVGFASPAEPTDPPVTVRDRAVDAGTATDGGTDVSPRGVVQTLGDPRPPRDAVPGLDPRQESDGCGEERAADAGTAALERGPEHPEGPSVEASPPPAIVAWLDAIEQRIVAGSTDGDGDDHDELPEPAVLRTLGDRAGSLADRIERGESGAPGGERG